VDHSAQAWINRLRLWSGLVLFAYVLGHFANHTLGIVSISALEAGRELFTLVWRSWPGTVALYGALLVHFAIACRAFVLRDRLKTLEPRDWAQLLLGVAIPFLLIEHVSGTRIAADFFGVESTYVYVLLAHWVLLPYSAFVQGAALVAAWGHAMIGLDAWLGAKPGYRRWRPYLFTPAVIVPTAAAIGWVDAGLYVQGRAADADWLAAALAEANATAEDLSARIGTVRDTLWLGYGGLLVAVIGIRAARLVRGRRSGRVRVRYPRGEVVEIVPGTTVLEASRLGGIAHASVCGGRGRCSTCRVRVERGRDTLPSPEETEARVLKRVAAPPGVRLACQLRPTADIQVTPLIAPGVKSVPAFRRDGAAPMSGTGEEREIAVLFADIRGFTELSEQRLPYDTVFLLNRYFMEMGTAVTESGGRIDKFIGDGVMALFGVEDGPADGSRRAIQAARRMAEHLVRLNDSLSAELSSPIRIGIGVHAGPCIVGEMGYGDAVSLTAIGDTVNIASRLEALTKEYGTQCVISAETARHANLTLTSFPGREATIRGREDPLPVHVIEDACKLPKAR